MKEQVETVAVIFSWMPGEGIPYADIAVVDKNGEQLIESNELGASVMAIIKPHLSEIAEELDGLFQPGVLHDRAEPEIRFKQLETEND